jgi:hypothetical protein
MICRRVHRTLLIALVLLSAAAPAAARQLSRAEIDAAFDQRLREFWDRVLAEEARTAGLTITDRRLSGSREAKTAVYTKALERLRADNTLLELFTPAYVRSLVDEQVESRVPTSVNATSTNPLTAGLPERSGSTSLLALAADLRSVATALASSNESAISLNLSALALVSLRNPALYSSIASYQQHSFARRLSGTFVFGAKIPESEITGFSGFPEFDRLLDTFGWDAKFRVWGDKDPRSSRWSDQTVRRAGLRAHEAAVLVSHTGTTPRQGESLQQALEDIQIVQTLVAASLGQDLAALKSRIARSPQLSLKVAGTHLTREAGRNKYAFAGLFDVGVGPVDITANAQYAITDDVRLGADQLFQTKIWTVSGGVTSHLAPNSIVRGRTIDWSVGGSFALFTDTDSLPVPVENIWKFFTAVEVPVGGGGRIPVSIVYTNDPNALTKERYVRGQIGLSYDFSALKQLFKPEQ